MGKTSSNPSHSRPTNTPNTHSTRPTTQHSQAPDPKPKAPDPLPKPEAPDPAPKTPDPLFNSHYGGNNTCCSIHLLDVLERDPLSVEQASVDYENLAVDHRAHRQVPEHLAKHAEKARARAARGTGVKINNPP